LSGEPAGDKNVFVGRFVRVCSLPEDGLRYAAGEDSLRRSAIGRTCRIVEPYAGTSTDGLRINTGEFRAHYAALSADGIHGYSLYLGPDDFEVVDATEELLLLYSEDIWQLLRPFGEVQDTPTFHRLAEAFGLIDAGTRPHAKPPANATARTG
jgi:hypothetical protein